MGLGAIDALQERDNKRADAPLSYVGIGDDRAGPRPGGDASASAGLVRGHEWGKTTFIKALDFYLLRSKNGHSTHRQRADLLAQGGGQDAFALDEIAINGRLGR